MRFIQFLIICVSITFFSCSDNSSTAQADADADPVPGYSTFGEVIDPSEAVPFPQFISMIAEEDSSEVKISGVIESVCQTKGCWINVAQDNESEAALFVKFKDYAFFVPKDAAGKEIILEGKAYRTVTPVDELKHFAEDAGKSQEEIDAITEPKEELRFMANGVLIKS